MERSYQLKGRDKSLIITARDGVNVITKTGDFSSPSKANYFQNNNLISDQFNTNSTQIPDHHDTSPSHISPTHSLFIPSFSLNPPLVPYPSSPVNSQPDHHSSPPFICISNQPPDIVDSPSVVLSSSPGTSTSPSVNDLSSIPLVIELPPLPVVSPIPVESQPISLESNSKTESVQNQDDLLDVSSVDKSYSNLEVSDAKSLWAVQSMSKVEKIWAFAKMIGVSGSVSDHYIINMIKEMEVRDKDASRKTENPSLSK